MSRAASKRNESSPDQVALPSPASARPLVLLRPSSWLEHVRHLPTRAGTGKLVPTLGKGFVLGTEDRGRRRSSSERQPRRRSDGWTDLRLILPLSLALLTWARADSTN